MHDYPDELAVTLRGEFGVSVYDVGDAVSPGEAFSLIKVAYQDPSTRLGAAVQKWEYPASMVDLVQIAAATGDKSDEVLPWSARQRLDELADRKVTESDVEAGRARLAQASAFRRMPDFDG
jgi:hypothetical protein